MTARYLVAESLCRVEAGGYGNLVLDQTDPFTEGFTIGDIWG